MKPACKVVVCATLMLSSMGVSSAFAVECRDDLINAREGMIPIRTPMKVETVSSQEAHGALSQGSGVSTGLSFQRTVEGFWRRKVRRHIEPSDLIVRYHVHGGGDRTGFASHQDARSVQFPIRIIPNTPRILCEDRDYRIMTGGFTLLARASGIGLAGLYSLEIDVDVEER